MLVLVIVIVIVIVLVLVIDFSASAGHEISSPCLYFTRTENPIGREARNEKPDKAG